MHAKSLAFHCKSAPLTGVPLALTSKNHLKTAFSSATKAVARSLILSPLTPHATAPVTASLLLKIIDSQMTSNNKAQRCSWPRHRPRAQQESERVHEFHGTGEAW
ncbi:hypothetical protein HPB50_018210 [Hyalomma asiaticum]|uniref:Uncharacterized protein n=1 Tax=Hyalomma asiaticum TaxID=266040 RepID=A0ACB7SGL7_HYAAI|nr:hypothetical protein HPB50_018210 [Hyalomma asiaticum]